MYKMTMLMMIEIQKEETQKEDFVITSEGGY